MNITTVFKCSIPFQLESGSLLPGFHLAYTVSGQLNEAKDNAVWIFHALTANSNPAEWWPGLVGDDKFFNPEKYFIVCVNMPGSCYGSIGPLDVNPSTDAPYYHDFPFFTTRDMIRAYKYLKDHLGIQKIHIGIGGSMGGQQLLEWAIEDPEAFEFIFPMATNAFHSSWGKAFNASQRMAIESDSSWKEKDPAAGMEGMKVARSIALISYRHYDTYNEKQKDEIDKLGDYKSDSYQRYQGEKLAKRFNAFSYYVLSQGMDAHHIGRGRENVENALSKVKAKTLVIGIHTDILYPVTEQEFLATHIPGAELELIDSLYGHDGFLLEYEKIEKLLQDFLQKNKTAHHQLQTTS